MPLLGKRITAAATAAAEKGARDEVRRQMKPVMDRLVKLVEKAETNGLVAGAKGPGGTVLGSIWLKIPGQGVPADAIGDLRRLTQLLADSRDVAERADTLATILEILDNDKGGIMQMDLDTGEIKPMA